MKAVVLLAVLLRASSADHESLWGTPVAHIDAQGFPARPWRGCLLQALTALRRIEPSVNKSNRGGGWQSEPTLLNFETDWQLHSPQSEAEALDWCFQQLKQDVYRAAYWYAQRQGKRSEQFRVVLDGCWANSNHQPGSWNAPHVHPGAHISGVTYLSSGGGEIVLHPPRPAAAGSSNCFKGRPDGACAIRPSAGDWLLFPSWLRHHARPSSSVIDRVSVSFNARLVRTAQGESYGAAEHAQYGGGMRAMGSPLLHSLWPTLVGSSLAVIDPLWVGKVTEGWADHVLDCAHRMTTHRPLQLSNLVVHRLAPTEMLDSTLVADADPRVVLRGLLVLPSGAGDDPKGNGIQVIDPRDVTGLLLQVPVGVDHARQLRVLPEIAGHVVLVSGWAPYFVSPNIQATKVRVLIEFQVRTGHQCVVE